MLVKNSVSNLQGQKNLQSMPISFSASNIQQHIAASAIKQNDTFERMSPVAKASTNNISFQPIKSILGKAHVISFAANSAKNKDQVALVGAEFPPYSKVGGVATVMKDYPALFEKPSVFIPYYNGNVEHDVDGNPTDNVKVLEKNGKPIYTSVDLSKVKVADLKEEDKGKNWWELEKVSEKTINLAGNDEKVKLYKVVGADHYMVYTEATAKMPKPYENPKGAFAYASSTSKEAKESAKIQHGDPYAKYNKAYVELVPTLEEKGFNPAHHLLSDSQTAYVPEFMAKKALDGDAYYAGSKSSYIGHNMGRGYQGETSAKNMFYNLAEPEHIVAVEKDPAYFEHLKKGQEDKYFRQFFPQLIDEQEVVNSSMIPIRHSEQGFVTRIDIVSEGYAESVANNPKMAPGLTDHLKKGQEKGRIGGILNGFGDPSFDPSLPTGSKFFDQVHTDSVTGVTHQPIKTYSKDLPAEEILKIKKENAINLLQRMYQGADPKYAIGAEGKKCEMIGNISPEFVKEAKEGKRDVKLFTSLGRGDFQKAHDITLRAFELFAKTEKGKDAALIFGGEFRPGDIESEAIKKKAKALVEDPALKGRVILLDGWLPAKAMASSAFASVYPSRFAPCELVEYEAMRYGTTPIVPNVGGMAQKNFDPRKEGVEKATSYKADHEFFMSHEELEQADTALHSKLTNESKIETKTSPSFNQEFNNLVKAEKDKLEFLGVQETRRDAIAKEKAMNSPEYQQLYRKCADEVISHEIADGMNAKASETPEVRAKMLKNALNAKTDWDNNNALHPSGKSSKEMYHELHINSPAKAPEKRFFSFPQAVFDRVKAATEKSKASAEEVVNGVKTTIDKSVQDMKSAVESVAAKVEGAVKEGAGKGTSHNGKYFAVGAAVSAVAAFAAYKFGNQKDGVSKNQEPVAQNRPEIKPVQPAPASVPTPAPVIANSNLKTSLDFFSPKPISNSK